MKKPVEIRFLGMEASPAVEAVAREKVAKLEGPGRELTSCRVTIEALHKHQQQGRPFAVRLDVTLPGHELGIDRVQNEDVYVALRDAFDGLRRRLDETLRRDRGEVKTHAAPGADEPQA
jgi:ribosome-associated translation inhibitor RaiA